MVFLKRIILFTTIFLISTFVVFPNKYITVKSSISYEYHNHQTFEAWYDKENLNPAYVVWDLTNENAIESSQNNFRKSWSFLKCGSSPNGTVAYKSSGFDRGHMCPNEDRDLSEEDARNTFRACNICPQTHLLNAGTWKKIEIQERSFAQKHGLVTIICGPIYLNDKSETFLKSGIRIPDGFFKVIVCNGEVILAKKFLQSNVMADTNLEKIEKETGLKIWINN